MRLIRGLQHVQGLEQGCVLTMGNFDGVHLGHREVIQKLVYQGHALNLPVVVMIFEPQPLEYFLADNAPSRLTRLREKAIQFAKLPVDALLVMKFDRHFADYEAELFVKHILLEHLHVKYLLVGDDFHFGKARRGNFALLKEMGQHFGFKVEDTLSFHVDGCRVSSTLIRDALANGDLQQAAALLGRPYSVCGRVVPGDKRGRRIGFPTANIQLFRKNTPVEGVFAVTMSGIGDEAVAGIANVGTRPTFEGTSRVLLETHLFDFDQDIYGSYVEVHFQKKIRDEIKFQSLQGIQQQIKKDIAVARQVLLT